MLLEVSQFCMMVKMESGMKGVMKEAANSKR